MSTLGIGQLQELVADPLAGLVEARMEEAISCGADVPELAALTIDAVLAECVAILEIRAAQHRPRIMEADFVNGLVRAYY